MRTGYLYSFQYHAGWLEAGSDSQWGQKLSEVLAHSLVRQLGGWAELSAGTSTGTLGQITCK